MKFNKIKNKILILLGAYTVFATIFAIVPYALKKNVNEDFKSDYDNENFFGTGSNDRIKLIETPKNAFDERIRLINKAEKKLDIVVHCVDMGETMDQFFGELLKAADRGVKIRFMVDAKVGGLTRGEGKKTAYALINHPNITYGVYNSFNFFKPWQWNTLFHDKFFIVDDRYVLLGGRNMSDLYFEPDSFEGSVTHDRDVLIYNTNVNEKNSVIWQVKQYCNELFEFKDSKIYINNLSYGKKNIAIEKYEYLIGESDCLREIRPELFRTITNDEYYQMTVPTNKVSLIKNPINTSKKEPHIAYVLKELALNAKEKVYIQTPYATGNKDLLETLNLVNDNGVEIKMLTNSMGSSPNIPAFSNYFYQRQKFLDAGIKIHEYNGKDSLHSKTYLFDERLSVVGSLNLDDRSFYIDTETMLVIDSPEFYKIMIETLKGYEEESFLVGDDNEYIDNKTAVLREVSGFKKVAMKLGYYIFKLFQFLI